MWPAISAEFYVNRNVSIRFNRVRDFSMAAYDRHGNMTLVFSMQPWSRFSSGDGVVTPWT